MTERKFLAGLQTTVLDNDLVSGDGKVLGKVGDTIIILPQTLADCVQFTDGTPLSQAWKTISQSITGLAFELATCANRVTEAELALVGYSAALVREANSVTDARVRLNSLAGEISANSAVTATVISDPEFSLPLQIENKGSVSFTVRASSLLNGGSIGKFYLTVLELGIHNREFAVTDGAAEIVFNTFSWMANQLLNISVTAEDNIGNRSRISRGSTTLIVYGIQPPEIISASSESIALAPMSVIGEIADTPKYVRVQIASDTGFTQLVFDNGVASVPPKDNVILITDSLEPDVLYYARARWVGEALGESPWSRIVELSDNNQ